MFLDYLVLNATTEHAEKALNTGDIFATLIVFILLMLLLKKFAWGPLMGVMKQREDLIVSEIEAAEKSRQESHQLLEEQRALLKEARQKHKRLLKTRNNKAMHNVKKSSQLHALKQAV